MVLAIGEMNEKGTVQMRQMNMLINQGVDAIGILARAYGTSTEEISELIQKRVLKSTEAIPLLLEGINDKFGGLMEKQSHTFLGMLSNIEDALTKTFKSIGDSLLPAAKIIEQAIFSVLNVVQQVAEWFGKLPAPVQAFALAAGTLAAALGPLTLALGGFLWAVGQIVSALPVLATLTGTTLPAAFAATATAATKWRLYRLQPEFFRVRWGCWRRA
jgi:tape measure domain-containing protein